MNSGTGLHSSSFISAPKLHKGQVDGAPRV
jgi:hypothetical protein